MLHAPIIAYRRPWESMEITMSTESEKMLSKRCDFNLASGIALVRAEFQ